MLDEQVMPCSEQARLKALHRLQILDTDYEPPFDRIVQMVAEFFAVPNAGIHLLDSERQWVKAFEGQRFTCAREDSVCQFTLAHDDLLVIPDLASDERTRNLAIVTGPPHVRFYAGMPLFTREHQGVGTLCILDNEPRPALDASAEQWLREFAGLVVETMELRVDYHRTRADLRAAVEFDALTGLRNRTSTIREVQKLQDTTPLPAGIAAISVRLDRMDVVARALGQAGSAAVMREVAERLHQLSWPDELLGHGGDESFLLLRVRQQQEEGRKLDRWLDRRSGEINAVLTEPIEVDGQSIHITASIGLTRFDDGSTAHFVADAASAAAIRSQEAGGNRTSRFSPGEFRASLERVDLEADLRAAVSRNLFVVHYQPIVDIAAGGRVVGAEALVRWPRGDKPSVGPDNFIPMAEEIGLIHDLGLWVFETACRDLATWIEEGRDIWVSVNLSPMQLGDPELPDKLIRRAQAAGIDCSRCKLEITESALATHFDDVFETIEALHNAGFRLALDDFGTGHSSLARMIHLPFDTLKVDRGFIRDCPDGPGASVVTAVSGLARRLDIHVVAEGVEEEQHERFLLDNAYTMAQGYRYARPMTPDSLSHHLAASA